VVLLDIGVGGWVVIIGCFLGFRV